MQPQRQQPTRLPRPWVSPGKNTGVGCHFLLQSMKVKSESEVAQSCPTLSDPMDCSLPGSSIYWVWVKSEVTVIQSCLTLSDPMDCRLPGSSVHGFSRQEYWSGVPLPSPSMLHFHNYISGNEGVCNSFVCFYTSFVQIP